MINLALLTFKSFIRDRVFQGILMIAVLFLFIPSVSELSMRQVAELSLTLSLSLISFILLLLSIFLGGTTLWKDMERRYTISVLGLPITRTSYVMGKFAGVALFVSLTTVFLGVLCCFAVFRAANAYPPDRPLVWLYVYLAIVFDALKYILLIAFAFLFSTVSTSFFLPVFGAVSIFFLGSSTQEVYDYVNAQGPSFSPMFGKAVTILYYILPNFSAFDLKVNAIYGVDLSRSGMVLTAGYFVLYLSIILTLSAFVFSRREIK